MNHVLPSTSKHYRHRFKNIRYRYIYLFYSHTHTHTHTHTEAITHLRTNKEAHTQTFMYACMCVCVCEIRGTYKQNFNLFPAEELILDFRSFTVSYFKWKSSPTLTLELHLIWIYTGILLNIFTMISEYNKLMNVVEILRCTPYPWWLLLVREM